ncbi:MAG: DMT family transporter [Hyphomicrobiales bacterium]
MHILRGVLLKVASTLGFTLMAACIKAVSDVVPVGESIFFRSFFALVPVFSLLAWRGELAGAFETRFFLGHILRGSVGTMAMVTWFIAIAYLQLPEATALAFATPLILSVLAMVILREPARAERIIAVIMGFLGILMILWPKLTVTGHPMSHAETIGAVAALSSAFLMAFAVLAVRKLIASEATSTIVVYFSLMTSVLSLLSLPFGWVWPTPWQALMLVMAGLLGGVSQLFLTECYRYADATTIAPFDYSQMIWAVIVGYMFFGEKPEPMMLLGAAIVILAGLLVIWKSAPPAQRTQAPAE